MATATKAYTLINLPIDSTDINVVQRPTLVRQIFIVTKI